MSNERELLAIRDEVLNYTPEQIKVLICDDGFDTLVWLVDDNADVYFSLSLFGVKRFPRPYPEIKLLVRAAIDVLNAQRLTK
uniref:Uncharacterized protein n=1 Tax=viral metagenome TaxID=1070528 RepID=A0A6M3X7M7_9ZZZZ